MIEELYWNIELMQLEIPKFICPTCQKGIIISDKTNITEGRFVSEGELFDITGDERDYKGYFTSISRCNNPDCLEFMTIAGETRLKDPGRRNNHEEDNFYFQNCKIVYQVKYTNPIVQLIKFPQGIPVGLTDIFIESFKLFWVDEDSCGNKIRSGIEKLLDFQKVNKTTINKFGKRQQLKLHQRIDKFKSKEPNIAKYLLALKWIGNQGSHSSSKLSRKELIDAYRILEVSLADLYDKTRVVVNRITKKINKEKKHKVK